MKLFYKILLIITLFPLIALTIEVIVSAFDNQSVFEQNENEKGRSLKVGILITNHTYINRGHTVGYHYELMNRFADENKFTADISIIKQSYEWWNDIFDGDIDIVILNKAADVVPLSVISHTIQGIELNDNHDIFIVNNRNKGLLTDINRWVGYFRFSEEYKEMNSNYYTRYKTGFLNGKVASLSPYDNLIKKYASEIMWDWRLLASVIYQESQFSMVATSRKEASGLMQVRPITANHFGIENIYDPEQNLKAGTAMLKRLEKMYHSNGIDSLNLIKFTLAAYNAGEGRIEDVRRYADHKGVNSHNWDSVTVVMDEMVNLKRGDTITKLGRFRGIETINYVDEVILRYENYKEFIR
jgi:Predicted soluble lytic transglycosylase fused to an ABC-type amino acid-binding protein